jgi:o-succinylbenzoate---CoA ligase
MTETLTHIAYSRLNGNKVIYPRYKPIDGVEVKTGKNHLLQISVPWINASPVKTNDLAQIHDDGTFTLLGRADNIINSGGYKVLPLKIEQAVIESWITLFPDYPAPTVLAFGVPDKKFGESTVVALESRPITDKQLLMLKKHAEDMLHPYEKPAKWMFHENFIYTQSGKVKRKDTIEKILVD